MLYYWWH